MPLRYMTLLLAITSQLLGLTSASNMPANPEEASSCTPATNEPPYTVDTDLVRTRCDGRTMNITFKTGSRQTLRLDVEKMRQLARSSDLNGFRMPDEVILDEDYGPDGELASMEEYERLEAVENYHYEHGTLHLLYPETYSEGYVLDYEKDDDYEDDENDGFDVDQLHESIRAVLIDEDLQPAGGREVNGAEESSDRFSRDWST